MYEKLIQFKIDMKKWLTFILNFGITIKRVETRTDKLAQKT